MRGARRCWLLGCNRYLSVRAALTGTGEQHAALLRRGIAPGALVLAPVLGVAAGLLGGWSLALLAPVFVAVCALWPAVGVVALIVACALDRVAIGVGGPNVRPDELAALALAGALLLRLALTPR